MAHPIPDPASFGTSRLARSGLGRLVAFVIFAGCFGVLFLTALAHFAPSRTLSAWADTVTPFAVHAMVVGAGASVAILARSSAGVVLSASIAIAVLGHAGFGYQRATSMPFTRSGLDAPRDHLRVLALNAWHNHPAPHLLETAIARSNADVIVLSEAGPNRRDMLARLSRIFPHSQSCSELWECSLAILSRLPLETGGAGRVSIDAPPLAWARIDARSIGLGVVSVIGTHLHRPTRNPLRHQAHADYLAKLVASVPGPIILAGDFNTTPYSASYRTLLNQTGLTPAIAILPTWPALPIFLPQVALDHIFVSADLRVVSSGAGPNAGSDHIPVWATIAVSERPSVPTAVGVAR